MLASKIAFGGIRWTAGKDRDARRSWKDMNSPCRRESMGGHRGPPPTSSLSAGATVSRGAPLGWRTKAVDGRLIAALPARWRKGSGRLRRKTDGRA